MNYNQVNTTDIEKQLDNWLISIQLRNHDAATRIHKDLYKNISQYTDENRTLFLVYESRYYLIQQRIMDSISSLEEAKKYHGDISEKTRYHLLFTEAMIYYEEKHYPEALDSFENAEKFLDIIEDPIITGEFHLRKGMTYYFLDITALSVIHAETAITSFKPHKTFHFLLARTEVLQGLNHIDINNYHLAEEYFHNALKHAEENDEKMLLATINHNLGYLYTQLELPATAIRYLQAALQYGQHRTYLKTLYFLADSLWKTNRPDDALQTYSKGLQKSIEKDDLTMKWQFAMLHKKYVDTINYESVWQDGIAYFQKINDHYNVRTYSKELADYYNRIKNYELSSQYYALALL